MLTLLVILLAQSPGSGAQFKVTLQLHGHWGLLTEPGDRCPAAPAGTDTLSGFVKFDNIDEDAVTYSGTLDRVTDMGLCEVRDTPDGEKWCGGELRGGGPVDVTIVVPAAGNDNDSLRIELEPHAVVTVTVGGNCSSLDNAAVGKQYKSHDAISFETSDAPGALVPPTGGLVARNNVYHQTREIGANSGYTLKVEPVP